MSKKISEMGAKLSMVDADEFTILDSADPDPVTKNKRVLKSVALAGLATQTSVDAVQTNLDNHAAASVAVGHPDGVTQTDLSNHKTSADQHPITGVTGLTTALDAKANTADLGNSASRDVGIGAGDVAQGDAPAAAVSTHETTYTHTNLPTTAQKAALDANATLSGANAVADQNSLPTSDQQAAMDAANAPSGANAFATIADVGSGGTFIGLTDTPGSYTGQQGKLVKVNATEDALIFGDPSGTTVSWGDIQGTLSNQTDLQTELDNKEDAFSKNTAFNKNFGLVVDTVCQGNDSRLSDARTPTAHATSHSVGQSDTIQLADLGSGPATNGQVATADGAGNITWETSPGGGWADGTVVGDWGLTVQALGSVGGATSAVDLDSGHAITATMTADHTFNFSSTAGHTATQWTATIDMTGGPWTPTWQFGGVAIDLPDGYDISGAFSRIEFHFIRTPTGVSVSERKIQ